MTLDFAGFRERQPSRSKNDTTISAFDGYFRKRTAPIATLETAAVRELQNAVEYRTQIVNNRGEKITTLKKKYYNKRARPIIIY